MSYWLQDLPVAWMSLVVFAATYLIAAAVYGIVRRLAVGERARAFKAMSPGMLPPLGIIFGLLVAFLAAQAWSDFERANSAVNREASALRAAVLLAATFPGGPETELRDLIRRHIDQAVKQEWPIMSQRRATLAIAPPALARALLVALALKPSGDGQVTAQRELVVALQTALDARRQRIAISRSTINWVKWSGVLLQGLCMLVAISVVHADNPGAGIVALAIFATGIAVSIVLIASHSAPFTGEISVGPDLLLQVMPEGPIGTPGP